MIKMMSLLIISGQNLWLGIACPCPNLPPPTLKIQMVTSFSSHESILILLVASN